MSGIGNLIAERDRAEDAANELADLIARHLGIDIGEHSNNNCPWQNAAHALRAANITRRTCTEAVR